MPITSVPYHIYNNHDLSPPGNLAALPIIIEISPCGPPSFPQDFPHLLFMFGVLFFFPSSRRCHPYQKYCLGSILGDSAMPGGKWSFTVMSGAPNRVILGVINSGYYPCLLLHKSSLWVCKWARSNSMFTKEWRVCLALWKVDIYIRK